MATDIPQQTGRLDAPDGWKLVPIEPDLKMVIAAENYFGRHAWAKMIAAAPTPPVSFATEARCDHIWGVRPEKTDFGFGSGPAVIFCTRCGQPGENPIEATAATDSAARAETPIPMVLYCPNCGTQHIDAPEEHEIDRGLSTDLVVTWSNPPHRSHLCGACECVWRPADVATTGVERIGTEGKEDTWPNGLPADCTAATATPTPAPSNLVDVADGRARCFKCGHAKHDGSCVNVAPSLPRRAPLAVVQEDAIQAALKVLFRVRPDRDYSDSVWIEISKARDGLSAILAAAPATAAHAGASDIEQYLLSVLPSVYYMDPPDGGSVSLLEQLRRMADDAAKYRSAAQPASVDAVPVATALTRYRINLEDGSDAPDEDGGYFRDDDVLALVEDLRALIQRLVHSLRKAAPDNELPDAAMDYLKRVGLGASPLRTAPPASISADAQAPAAHAGTPMRADFDAFCDAHLDAQDTVDREWLWRFTQEWSAAPTPVADSGAIEHLDRLMQTLIDLGLPNDTNAHDWLREKLSSIAAQPAVVPVAVSHALDVQELRRKLAALPRRREYLSGQLTSYVQQGEMLDTLDEFFASAPAAPQEKDQS